MADSSEAMRLDLCTWARMSGASFAPPAETAEAAPAEAAPE